MGRKNRDSSDSESESDRRAKVGFDDRPSYSSGEVCPRSQEKKGRKDDKRKALVQSFMSMILHEPLFIPSVLASCANLALWQDRRSRGRSKERRKERSAERKPAPKRGRGVPSKVLCVWFGLLPHPLKCPAFRSVWIHYLHCRIRRTMTPQSNCWQNFHEVPNQRILNPNHQMMRRHAFEFIWDLLVPYHIFVLLLLRK